MEYQPQPIDIPIALSIGLQPGSGYCNMGSVDSLNKSAAEPTAMARAVAAAGGVSALARLLGMRPQRIATWKHRGMPPPKHVIAVERAVECLVTRYELRPDIYPSPYVAPPRAAPP